MMGKSIKFWYPDSDRDILDVLAENDDSTLICLKDKFGNTIHNRQLAVFTFMSKKTGVKTKYVLLNPLESYGADEGEPDLLKDKVVYRVDEVNGRHVLVKETDYNMCELVYTHYYMLKLENETAPDSTEYDATYNETGDDDEENDDYDEYEYEDEDENEDENEDEDGDGDEVSDDDPEELPPLGEAVHPNMVNMLWSEECETDIVDIMAMGDRNVILFIKNDEGKRDEYVRACMLEYEGTYYALLAPVIEGKIKGDNLVAFRIEDGGKHRNHVLKREKNAALCKRVEDEYRKLLVRYGNKKQK